MRKLLTPLALLTLSFQSQAATFTVTNLNDSGPGTLRQAIDSANNLGGNNTINFSVNGTIALASNLPPVTANTHTDDAAKCAACAQAVATQLAAGRSLKCITSWAEI